MSRSSFQASVLSLIVVVVLLPAPLRGSSPEIERRVRQNQGIVAFTQRDYLSAEQIFSDLVKTNPDDPGAWYWLGLSELQRNRYSAATAALQRVMQLAPDRVEVRLDAAIASVAEGQYERAIGWLKEYLSAGTAPSAVQTMGHFFLGVAQYKTKRYDDALKSFESAEPETTDPDLQANIAWYRSWILTEQGKPDLASLEFAKVAQLTTDVDQQVRAKTLAEQVKAGPVVPSETVSPLQFRLDLGYHYDSNVILLGDNTSLPIGLNRNDDYRFGLSTDLRYLIPMGDQWLMGFGWNTFHSWHASLEQYNVQTYAGRGFVNYFLNDRTTLGVQYEYDFNLVGREAFLSRHQLTPSLRYVEAFHDDGTSWTSSTLFASYEDRDYHDDYFDLREDRDGSYTTLGLTQSFNLCQPRKEQGDTRWLSAAVGYRFENESTVGSDFDLSAHGLNADLSVPLPWELTFDFSGNWMWEGYWQPNSQDYKLRERKDFVQRYSVSLGREWELDRHVTMGLRGELAYILDDSNVLNSLGEAIYSYDRTIAGITLSLAFH